MRDVAVGRPYSGTLLSASAHLIYHERITLIRTEAFVCECDAHLLMDSIISIQNPELFNSRYVQLYMYNITGRTIHYLEDPALIINLLSSNETQDITEHTYFMIFPSQI